MKAWFSEGLEMTDVPEPLPDDDEEDAVDAQSTHRSCSVA
jgi:hypothetical protein